MSKAQSIIVIGSSNTDMVIKAPYFPLPGETILGGNFFMFPGGKGANQAVAAARLGGNVTFIAKVGNDVFGKQAIQQFKLEGINTDFVLTSPHHPSGVALITINEKGENTIVVAQGANSELVPADVQQAEFEIEKASLVLIQLEIPIETVSYAIKLASKYNKKVILNPAPAQPLDSDLLRQLYLITPNESEAEVLLGMKITDLDSIKEAAGKLIEKGVENVVITLGEKGAYFCNANGGKLVSTARVTPIDTTAAGDVFNSALAVAISEDKSLMEAVQFANKAAAISVTRMGAQSSAPYKRELGNE